MKSFLTNWKTTTAGAALIFAGLGDLLTQLSAGSWDGTRLMADITGIISGAGLIFAKDGNVTGGSVRQ